jgi:hypothetical protein
LADAVKVPQSAGALTAMTVAKVFERTIFPFSLCGTWLA